MRFFKHLLHTHWHLQRHFPKKLLAKIADMIKESERDHRGEIRFAVEAHAPLVALLKNETPHQRALEAFIRLKVWDTEENNGVLIYLCLADRAVEIIADRNINKQVSPKEWKAICDGAATRFAKHDYEGGAHAAIRGVHEVLARHFPAGKAAANELSNRQVVL